MSEPRASIAFVLMQRLGLIPPDEKLADRFYSLASDAERARIDAAQRELWRAQMDQQMPWATREEIPRAEMPTLEDAARYGGSTIPAPLVNPPDPYIAATVPQPPARLLGNAEYPLRSLEGDGVRLDYGEERR